MENDDRRDDVPDSWEEASDKTRQQALENKIEEAKLKNRQQQMLQQQRSTNDHFSVNCGVTSTTVAAAAAAADQNPLQSTSGGGGSSSNSGNVRMPIRILKRPESAGDLEKFSDVGGSRIAAPNQPRNKPSGSNSVSVGAGGASAKSLEERATAYAQARERIFGVVDPVIHEDLPIQPKIMPRTKNGNSPVSVKPSNNS